MEPNILEQANQENEISLKDLVIKLRDWFTFLLKNWVLIAVFATIGAGLGVLKAMLSKTLYVGELTFILEDGKANPLGGYAGLASQFGIDVGSSPGSGIFSGDNIMEFLKSRLLVEKTLLSPIGVTGKTKSLANYYIETHDLKSRWKNNPSLQQLDFPVLPDRNTFSIVQDSVLNSIYLTIIKNNLTVSKPDKKLSFIFVKCASSDEYFSKYFVERLVKEATDFYIQTKTKRSKSNVDKLQQKADSLERLLTAKTYSAAVSQDLNLNPARNIAKVGAELVTRDKMVLQTLYGEVIKNLELSRMSMAQEAPIIQIVDTPILPLKKEKFGKLKGLIIGGILGGFLITILLTIRRIYKRIMA